MSETKTCEVSVSLVVADSVLGLLDGEETKTGEVSVSLSSLPPPPLNRLEPGLPPLAEVA